MVGEAGAQEPAGGIPGLYAVIPAGGSGTRLWPLSRTSRPKFLLDLSDSGSSMLHETVDRLRPLCADRLFVITGRPHADAVAADLADVSAARIVIEPAPRDSLPAIGLAAAMVEREAPAAVLGSFAADHVIADIEAFERSVTAAVECAAGGDLVTLGIQPTYAATGYGYLEVGAAHAFAGPEGSRARRVTAFVEKPSTEVAQAYLAQGYLWNAGMFVVQAAVLMQMIERWQPELAWRLRGGAADPDAIESLWSGIPSMSIDRAIAEPAAAHGQVAVVPATFQWDDIGDFAALADHLAIPGHPVAVHVAAGTAPGQGRPTVMSVDSSGLISAGAGRAVVALGVRDIVIVDTPDALLVTTRERVQDVKAVVQSLREQGLSGLT